MKMDKDTIYQRIQQIADRLHKDQARYTRADLAYELKDIFPNDSLALSKAVWEAYLHFNKHEHIREAFTNNEGNRPLVDEYELLYLIEQQEDQALFSLIQQQLKTSDAALSSLDKQLSDTLDVAIHGLPQNTLAHLMGTKGVSEVQVKAKALLNRYSLLVDNYTDARAQVKTAMVNFVELRAEIGRIYQEYSNKLVDLYGDAIKLVAPDIFDFDRVAFLEVENMLAHVQLEYDQLSEKCTNLIGEIADSFSASLRGAASSYKVANNRNAGLILAGLAMVNHYVDAHEKSTQSRQELETFKQLVRKDVTQIQGDYARLASIYKLLNEVYIPQASIFQKHSAQVLSSELKRLFDALYQAPEVKALAEQRSVLLSEIKTVDYQLTDSQLSIAYYTENINRGEALLTSKEAEYRTALSRKPSKPFFLFNLFTLGQLNKAYNRDFYEWNSACAPVVQAYEKYQVDLKLDREELQQQQQVLQKSSQRQRELKRELAQLREKMLRQVAASDSIKLQMSDHLAAVIQLLRLAKRILESKLDQQHVEVVQIKEAASAKTDLPVERFTQELKAQIASVQPATAMVQGQQQLLQKGVDILAAWQQLHTQEATGKQVDAHYKQELARLQKAFFQEMRGIDKQSDVLLAILKQSNTAQTPAERKAALLALSGEELHLTDEDVSEILNGTKKIIL